MYGLPRYSGSTMLAVVGCSTVLLLGAAGDFVTIPSSSLEIEEQETGVPVRVEISSFLISTTEVTQREFVDVMGFNPSHHRNPAKPVDSVTWWDAVRFCNLLSLREGLEPCYDLSSGGCDFERTGFRLPTESEWTVASALTEIEPAQLREYGRLGTDDTRSVDALMLAIEKGTSTSGLLRANRFGLYDMIGNVWEWCYDYNSALPDPSAFFDPVGGAWSAERVLRGGSFATLVEQWNRGFRSSLDPETRSRFTGFRICRSLFFENKQEVSAAQGFFAPFDEAPDGFRGNTGDLGSPLVLPGGDRVSSREGWAAKRAGLLEKWESILGIPKDAPPAPKARTIGRFRGNGFRSEMMYLQVEGDYWEKILLMVPDRPVSRPLPAVIVPYYDVDTPAGENLGGRVYSPKSVRSFGNFLVRQGYIVLCVRWWGESYGENYNEAVANLRLRHPNTRGHGKWVWDARRAVDYLCSLPAVDRRRIGMIGHSLGAKMTLYAAALDERIAVAVASEGGIGFEFSNYDDFWYLGDFMDTLDERTDQHELLALMAPRPFLLIGGEDADNDRSWYFVNSGREVYSLFDDPRLLGYYNHRSGHSPTPRAVRLALDWFRQFFGSP